MVRLTDRPDMTLDVYRGRKTTPQQFLEERICCWSSKFFSLRVDPIEEVGKFRTVPSLASLV